jgi:hypothetical protein
MAMEAHPVDITALRRPVAVMVHGSWADVADNAAPPADYPVMSP